MAKTAAKTDVVETTDETPPAPGELFPPGSVTVADRAPPFPTIGRIVHYRERGRIFAGLIGDVLLGGGEVAVDLGVLERGGWRFLTAVPYSGAPDDGTWCWPPRA